MANVTAYSVLLYGTKDGYQDNRAQIQLMDGSTVLGWVRFHDRGAPFPEDSKTGDKIVMHLPSDMLAAVIDVLRNEKPIKYYFASNHAFLGTAGPETVGEGE